MPYAVQENGRRFHPNLKVYLSFRHVVYGGGVTTLTEEESEEPRKEIKGYRI